MNPMVLLTLISVIAVAALFIALAAFLVLILRELNPTGLKPVSFLAKIRMGLRAIEVETGHIPREVTKLNAGLTSVRDDLAAVEANSVRLASAVVRQEGR